MASYGGIDLGGTKIQTVIVDQQNKVLGQARRPTPTEGAPEDVAREIAQALRDAAKAAELEPEALEGIGVGSPGVIEGGNVSTARNLPGWEGTFALAKALASELGVKGTPIEIGNDVQVATDAEFELGAGRAYDSLIGVFWGTGVGAGLILDGKPWLGQGGCSS
jgi:glucokinase